MTGHYCRNVNVAALTVCSVLCLVRCSIGEGGGGLMFKWLDSDDSVAYRDGAYDVPAEKMAVFYAKLSSLRDRQRQQNGQISTKAPLWPDVSSSSSHNKNTVSPTRLPAHTATGGRRYAPEGDRLLLKDWSSAGRLNDSTVGNTTATSKVNGDTVKIFCGRPKGRWTDEYVVNMGWHGARCLWSQYRSPELTEPELNVVRERLKRLVRFWTLLVGGSLAVMWAAFGFCHELFCCGVKEPETYAKDVRKYLTMVPPNVVVTANGKMYAYSPSAEERFLWESAKKIATLRI